MLPRKSITGRKELSNKHMPCAVRRARHMRIFTVLYRLRYLLTTMQEMVCRLSASASSGLTISPIARFVLLSHSGSSSILWSGSLARLGAVSCAVIGSVALIAGAIPGAIVFAVLGFFALSVVASAAPSPACGRYAGEKPRWCSKYSTFLHKYNNQQ